jgi:RNA polymerase sigma-70 factor (ECF subfamily)
MARGFTTASASDGTLMRRVQSGDVEAFEELYDRHVTRALRVAYSVLLNASRAEDAVQEGFLSIWRSRGSYRPDSASFAAWAMQIVRNRAIDLARRDTSAHEDPAARDETNPMLTALRHLPEDQAEVIALAFYGELTHSEIAEQLSLSPGTVKGRMRLGLKKLRDQMHGAG